MKLVIVESPNKISKIAHYLGSEYKVLASVGHIEDLAKTGEYNLGVDIKNGFKPKYILMEDKVQVLNNILKEAMNAEQIILATDLDREGEFISFSLQNRLIGCNKPIVRATFAEITKPALTKALANTRSIDTHLVAAQEARRVLDRIVGFMASPYVSNVLQQRALSAGRVQSVIVRLVADREKEIKAFVPETYWNAQLNLSDGTDEFAVRLDRKITDEKDAKAMKALLSNSPTFTVIDVQSKLDKKNPPPPLITSSMLQACIKDLKFPADKVTKIAQKLFEEGLITYIRTDSPSLSDDALKMLDKYYAEHNIPHPKKHYVYKAKGENAQEAHEAIRVTNVDTLPSHKHSFNNEDERRVYEVVWKYTVACQANPAIWDTLKVVVQLDGTKETFVATGKALKDKGYLEILGIGSDAKIDIPNLKKGQKLTTIAKSEKVQEQKTKPPARWNTISLLQQLENRSIGRPSTLSSLLTRINDKNYVVVDKEVYNVSDLGAKVADMLSTNFKFMDYDFTAKMEQELDLIAAGKKTYIEVVSAFFTEFREQLEKAYKAGGVHTCPHCGSAMVRRTGKFGDFLGCTGYPKCKHLENIQQ
jgi:DNA topoisomerase-1